jgi:hypothetical protein
VIVFCIVRAIRTMNGTGRLSLWYLLGALLTMALSDSAYTYLTEVASYSSSRANPLDAGWIAAYLGIALAARSSRGESVLAPVPGRCAPSLTSLLAPLLPVFLALSAAAAELGLGDRLDRAAWLMAFALVALVLMRQVLTITETLEHARDREDALPRLLTHAVAGPHDDRDATAGPP